MTISDSSCFSNMSSTRSWALTEPFQGDTKISSILKHWVKKSCIHEA